MRYMEKAALFNTMLKNAYRDEDNQEFVQKLELKESELTEDFTAMLQGYYFLYREITEDDIDLVGFTHLLNRLAIQYLNDKKA